MPALLEFGDFVGGSAFWIVLEGQSMIRLAHALMRATTLPVHVQVMDPPKWWLHAHFVDAETSDEILVKFDGVLRGARSLGAASWNMAEIYGERYGVSAIPIVGSLPASLALPPALAADRSTVLRIGFAGQFYAAAEWGTLLSALDLLNWAVDGLQIELDVYANSMPELLPQHARRIYLHGWQENQALVPKLALCDVLYCPYWFDEIHREDAELCFASKIAAYLASGRPVLFHGPDYSSPSKFLSIWDAAWICNSPRAEDLAQNIRRLLSDPALYDALARKGRNAFDKNLTHGQLGIALCDFLQV